MILFNQLYFSKVSKESENKAWYMSVKPVIYLLISNIWFSVIDPQALKILLSPNDG